MWQSFNGFPVNKCTIQIVNGSCQWANSSKIFQNITNSTSPLGAVQSTITNSLPWFWPLFPFVLYLYLFIIFADSPGKGKIYMIAALVLVISIFMALGGLIVDAVINFVIFIVAFWLSGMFDKGGSTIGG